MGNLATGQVAEVTTPEGGSTKPTFTGDDSALVFTRDDPSALTAASLWRLPLRDDHLAAAGEAQPWLSDALLGTVYRRGALFDLRIKRAGRGSGSIVSDPGGIDCGVECSALYPPGTSVTLTPRADYGSAFAGWSGACRGRKPCRITLRNKPVQAVARFTRLPRVTLKVQLMLEKGAGRVISSPVGIDCGTRCRGCTSRAPPSPCSPNRIQGPFSSAGGALARAARPAPWIYGAMPGPSLSSGRANGCIAAAQSRDSLAK